MAKDYEEFYDRFVNPRLDKIDGKLDDLCGLLKGKNSSPGLIDDVRDNTRFRNRIFWAIGTLIAVTIGQAVVWVRTKITGQ